MDSHEELANRVLANIIRQLANLGRHANDIFEGLDLVAEDIKGRSEALEKRTANVGQKIEVSEVA